jgi:hypothetical protein
MSNAVDFVGHTFCAQYSRMYFPALLSDVPSPRSNSIWLWTPRPVLRLTLRQPWMWAFWCCTQLRTVRPELWILAGLHGRNAGSGGCAFADNPIPFQDGQYLVAGVRCADDLLLGCTRIRNISGSRWIKSGLAAAGPAGWAWMGQSQ